MMMKFLLCTLCLGSLSLVSGQTCRGKTYDEKIKEIRVTENCPDAAPTGCACEGNKQATVTDCPEKAKTLWDSDGKKCVAAYPDKDDTWSKHTWHYPEDYGKECSTTGHIEPGSYDCTKVKEDSACDCTCSKHQEHKFEDGHAGYNADYNSATWCTMNWCFVNPCECDKILASSSWFEEASGGKTSDGMGLYYSYSQCGATDEFTPKDCSLSATDAECGKDVDCVWDKASSTDVEADAAAPAGRLGGFVVFLSGLLGVAFA
jgi:hypothetical protein